MINFRRYTLFIIRIIILLILPFLLVQFVSGLVEFRYFSYTSDIFQSSKENTEVRDIETSNNFIKNLIKVDIPSFYDVFIINDTLIEFKEYDNKLQRMMWVVNNIKIIYKEKKIITDRPILLRSKDEINQYILNMGATLVPEGFKGDASTFFTFYTGFTWLNMDKSHQRLIYDFRLAKFIKVFIYVVGLFLVYPFLSTLDKLQRFIKFNEPFSKKS